MTLADEITAVLTITNKPMTNIELATILNSEKSHVNRVLNTMRAARAVRCTYRRTCKDETGKIRGRGKHLWMLV